MNKFSSLFLAGVLTSASTLASADVSFLGDVTDNDDGSYTLTTGTGSASDSFAEFFLGLSSGALDAIASDDAIQGSVVTDTFFLSAGDTLSFNWLWSTDELPDGEDVNDFAFASVSSVYGEEVVSFADTYTPNDSSGVFTWTASADGDYTFGIGVMDDSDDIVDSYLTVSPVPEPSTYALMLGGLGLVGFMTRRRKQQA